jgi:glycosyltransferase involved in cell wall biosynthesis
VSKRLLWIHQNFVTARQPGNSRPIHQLAALLDAGWCIDLVCTSRGYLGDVAPTGGSATRPAPGAIARRAVIERDGPLSIHRLPAARTSSRAREYVAFVARVLPYVARLQKPDVIVASSPPLPQIVPSLVFSHLWRRPLVLEVRDLWPAFLEQGRMLRNRPLVMAMRWLESVAYHSAARCVAVSPGFRPYLVDMGVAAGDLHVIPTGGDPDVAGAGPDACEAWRRDHGVAGATLAIYTGSFNQPYPIDLVLEAARRSAADPDVVWILAGNGRARDRVVAAARELANLRYLGNLSKDDLRVLYSTADIAVVGHSNWPLLDTTICGKLFDYLACGIPVVSVRHGTMGCMVRAADAGVLLSEPSAAALCDAVRSMARLPAAERRRMGRNGRRWVLEHVHCHDAAARMRAVVESCIGLAAGRRRRSGAGAAARALRDVVLRRGSRALESCFGADPEAALQAAFAQWMGERRPLRAPARTPLMPEILSGRMPVPLAYDRTVDRGRDDKERI